jgi:hypothetical protein
VFHSKDGWFFERAANGAVHIVKTDGKVGGPTLAEVALTAETWASVVASVSEQGETRETWMQALEFHMGDPDAL